MRVLFLSAALALAACGQTEGPAPAATSAPPAQALDLTCAAFAGLTPAALAERFGAENITMARLDGPEGEQYDATLVFANDPSRRLQITWDEAQTQAASIMTSDASAWRGEGGLALGDGLADVERVNGRPFKLFGFGWDYGGWVSDWNGGALAERNGCATRINFSPRQDSNTSAQGDGEFASDSVEVRAADPIVATLGLTYSDGR